MKKNIFIYATILLCFSLINVSLAESALISELRTSKPYHAIVMKGDAELILVPSDKFEITLEGTEAQIMNMVTLLKDDTLFITQTNNKDKKNQRTRVIVGIDELVALHVKGKTDVSANGYINTNILTIRAEEGAVVNLDVRALKVKAKSLGSSSINISGSPEIIWIGESICSKTEVIERNLKLSFFLS